MEKRNVMCCLEYQRAHTERHGRNCSLQHILIDDNELDEHMATDGL